MVQCNGKTINGEKCKKEASIGGYCATHYFSQVLKIEKRKKKRSKNRSRLYKNRTFRNSSQNYEA